jgi:hypothetical protein
MREKLANAVAVRSTAVRSASGQRIDRVDVGATTAAAVSATVS